ncbi:MULTISPECIES: (2Fe-2S)-binding protein [Acetobacter]|uniref:Bacterioferritin-associated ferredoxin n=1 Tax=Acetobacter thailandicus TaxID=1502842 RepID=A0ABT3QG70_9PROT|nr:MULTISPECIES: (2Fe-2S)-binding protein [Acetobacter]MBS0960604.1 (2Fe-2S)-binding protein [Acetobacter thailandicus]MBS0980089.1 (2Fe-2S)-binding protein [Acetobacter thailandicus]MBS0986976.1 (2Fe-2S)-binding protein [Acetobacter thailandicus]MBS1003023.1 (2Fe-2S)-binding protein [Acetobacter thailandicus]MCX2564277.1 (2Fe-2S)-binding protein [Acetobacter thailandicus]
MIICSCNSLTHKDVEHAVEYGATHPRDIYAARGCKAKCGNCVPGVVCMLREALVKKSQTPALFSHLSNCAETPATALTA